MSYSEKSGEWRPEFLVGQEIFLGDGTRIEVTGVYAEQVYLCSVTRPNQKMTEAFLKDLEKHD